MLYGTARAPERSQRRKKERLDVSRGEDPHDPPYFHRRRESGARKRCDLATGARRHRGAQPGAKDRIVEAETLRRFVNVYVNDEDVRFTGGLNAPTADGDVVVVLPAVAGG